MYINFRLSIPNNTGGAANADFQVRLSASGYVGFYYGSTAAPWPSFQSIAANPGGYSIGIGNSSTDFASVTMTGPTTATYAFGTANDANTQAITGPFDIYFTPDNTPPVISAQTIPNSPGTDNRTLVKTITDNGKGVPLSGSLIPRIYYNKNGGTYVSTSGAFNSGTSANSSWTFTVDHALVGGVVAGDVINYFVAAQDENDNVSSNPSGVVAADVNTITTPPASPSSYFIPSNFSGVVTVGAGGDYESLTNTSGLFEQLNAGTVLGNVTVNIISDLSSESGSIKSSAWAEGPGGPFTVTINPVGNRVITLSNAMTLDGTMGLIIDGLNDGTNSLTFSKPSGYGILIIQNGASNNTITRTTMEAYGGTTATYYMLRVNNSSTTVPISSNTISYCTFTTTSSSASGIYQAISLTGYSSTCDGPGHRPQ